MSAKREDLIVGQAAAGAGLPKDVSDFNEAVLAVTGITTATVKLEGSNEQAPTIWTQVGADITADGFYEPSALPKWIRANVSAWTAGTINVRVILRKQ